MLVLCEQPSPRHHYAIRHVLERMLGLKVRFAQGLEEFRSATGPRLLHATDGLEGVVHVPRTAATGLLAREEPTIATRNGGPVLFPVGEGFDLFSAVFHLLSLADEARCTDLDAHGRVRTGALFTVRHGLADRPWVDEWAMRLGAELDRNWPGLLPGDRRYRHMATMDVDNLMRYAGRPWVRGVGASVKSALRGDLASLVERWRVRGGGSPDPYIAAIDRIAGCTDDVDRAILFLLLRGGGPHDHAARITPEATTALEHARSRGVRIGLHPSYRTSGDASILGDEVALYREHFGGRAFPSRQHFLRWRLPHTPRWLLAAGVVEDHSLGFHDRAGFRASTCTPFPWYDLELEQETPLMLCPFAAMDSAIVERMGQGPTEAVRTMNAMSDLVRSVSGTFVSVWHDRYLSGHREFAPWPQVFAQVIEHARA